MATGLGTLAASHDNDFSFDFLSLKKIHSKTQNIMKSIIKYFPLLVLTLMIAGCGGSGEQQQSTPDTSATLSEGQSAVKDDVSNPNIVQVAVGSADHSTLVAALKAAQYVDALTNVGPFTVFAPENSAFAKLPAGTVENLLKPENKAQLVAVLTYHVVPGKVYSKDQILELYLNKVYFGGGAYGVDAASRRFFDHGAEDISLAEAAIIAGLVKAPSRYAPTADAKAALDRAKVVVEVMP